ncbi:MAG: hypothetical protein MHPSP_004013, partial [Paramarteilia canceri]
MALLDLAGFIFFEVPNYHYGQNGLNYALVLIEKIEECVNKNKDPINSTGISPLLYILWALTDEDKTICRYLVREGFLNLLAQILSSGQSNWQKQCFVLGIL